MKTTETTSSNGMVRERRAFLRLAGAGIAAGGVAAVAVGSGTGQAEAAAGTRQQDAGYRETEHVKKFYDSARF